MGSRPGRPRPAARSTETDDDIELPDRSPEAALDNLVFEPPFLGSKVVKGISIDEISKWINETALFRNQWQFRPEKNPGGTPESDQDFRTGSDRSSANNSPGPGPRDCWSRRSSTGSSPRTLMATTW
ncbi:MAG: hypothetical protein R2789_08600 [Microthrixaceae bacterium]